MKKNATLLIKIDTKEPMELNEIAIYLNAIAKEYDSYCKNKLKLAKKDRKIDVINIKKGSLLIELATDVGVAVTAGAIVGFGKYLIAYIKSRSKKEKNISIDHSSVKITVQDNLIKLLDLSTNYGDTHIHIHDNDKPVSKEFFSRAEIEDARDNAIKYRKETLEEETLTKHKQRLYWVSVSFSETNRGSDKGIIKQLDKSPHKVTFENPADKKKMIKFNENLKQDWQDLLYDVDVEVIKKQGKIKSYNILHVYTGETISK